MAWLMKTAFAVALLVLSSPVGLAQSFDARAVAASARAEIGAALESSAMISLEAIAAAEPDPGGIEGFAIAMLMQRHLDESAWLYALALERDPNNAGLRTSLGALGLEMAAAGRTVSAVAGAANVALQRAALRDEPDDPAIMANLAAALLALGETAARDEAIALLRRAVEVSGGDSHYLSRLAEALMAAGLEEEARALLGRAFADDPESAAVAWTNANIFAGGAVTPPAGMCKVDFRCNEVCPGGIIGRLNYVTCEMSNASAISSCEAGQPFPSGFNCDAQMPRFGILIPGLDPGFSILTPWGSIDILFQGDGRIDYKIRVGGPAIAGPLKTYLEAKGSFQPSRGELKVQGSGGVSLGLPATGSTAADIANKLGFGPSVRIQYNHTPGAGERVIEPSIRAFRGKIVG